MIATRGFTGPVSRDEQNRAAHGNVTYAIRCDACGAVRFENVNGCHREVGPWAEVERPRYVARGPVRGDCGHEHRSLSGALVCADADARACASLGGGSYSDRLVMHADGSPLTEEERETLATILEWREEVGS